MISIRPHHLLCMHGFQGNGYNNEFTTNMSDIIDVIKNTNGLKLNIVFNTDDICSKCPKKLGENLCDAQDKVNKLDNGVIETLGLQEKVYLYKEIITKIKIKLTKDKFKNICNECEWYSTGHCLEGISRLIK